MTYADVVVFNLIRGYRSSEKDHYTANESIPLLKAHAAKMEEEPKIKDYLASSRT